MAGPPTGAASDPDLPVGAEGRFTAALTAAVRAEIRADRLGPITIDDVERTGPAGKLAVLVQASPESGCLTLTD